MNDFNTDRTQRQIALVFLSDFLPMACIHTMYDIDELLSAPHLETILLTDSRYAESLDDLKRKFESIRETSVNLYDNASVADDALIVCKSKYDEFCDTVDELSTTLSNLSKSLNDLDVKAFDIQRIVLEIDKCTIARKEILQRHLEY